MNKGFTLIELLVVVLIIGILAAVALPQYQKAVEKSRATEAVQLLSQIANAENILLMSQGEFTNDLNALDVQMPGISANASTTAVTKNYHIVITKVKTSNTPDLEVVATRWGPSSAASDPYAYAITLTMAADGQTSVRCQKTASGTALSTATCTSIANGDTNGYIKGN